MNITMNELLLLGNKKIRFGEGDSKTASAAPVPETTTNPQSGMNALMFQGMKNLMSNPQLAQELGASNNSVAFKSLSGAMKKVIIPSTALVLGAASLQSCKDETFPAPTNINVNVENSVTIDLSMLQSLLAELKQLRQDMADRDAKYQGYFQQMINMYENFVKMYKEKTASDEVFQNQILANQEIIIAMLEIQGVDQATALRLLQDILNSNKSMEDKLAAIKGLVSDIKAQLNTVIANQEAAAADRATLLAYAENMYTNVNVLVEQGKKYLESDSVMIANQEQMLTKLDILDVDMNANSEALARQLGIQHSQLMGMLMNMGFTQAQIAQMTTAQIINAIKENTAVTKAGDERLAKLMNTVIKQGYISEAQRNEMINLLNSIDGTLDNIYSSLLRVEAKFDSYAKQALAYARSIDRTGKATYEEIKGLRESTDSMLVQNNTKIELLEQILEENQRGNKISEAGMRILIAQGYTQAQITAMGFAQANSLLSNILIQEKATYAKLQEISNFINMGNIEEAAKMIIELLQSIDSKLDTINANIEKLYNSIEDAKKKFFPMFENLVVNNTVQTSVLKNMDKTLKVIASDVASLKANTDSLIVLANEKPDEIIEAIKNGDAGIMAVLEYNNISQQQAMSMSTKQIVDAINKFKNEYVTNEEKENNQRLIIIELLQNPVYNTNEGVIRAINEVTAAINAGNTNLAAELEKLYQKLAEIEAKLTPVLSKLSAYIDDALSNWNKLFDYMDKAQKAAEADHAQMNAYLKLANVYLEKLLKAAEGIEANTDSINNIGGGGGITAAELDALLDKYATKINNNNNANINKLIPLLEQMAEDISKLDKTDDPDYTAMLELIKDALEKLRVHEGIQNTNDGITP